MVPKKKLKREPWNKGLVIGKRDGFTPAEVKRIRGLLADRGVLGDVQRRDGSIRPVIEVVQARAAPPVRCALSKVTVRALEKWITASGRKRTDFLFPGRGARPMSTRQLNRLLKL